MYVISWLAFLKEIPMARAFILEPTRLDVTSASQYGDITTLFPRGVTRNDIWTGAFRKELLEVLERLAYDPTEDYVVVAGSMVPITVMLSIIVREKKTSVKLLLYNSTDRAYIPHTTGAHE
jgi:hypothetical protein